jgi:hypothetical protein
MHGRGSTKSPNICQKASIGWLPKKNIGNYLAQFREHKNTIHTACPNCSLKTTLPETLVFQLSFNSEEINMQIVFIQWDTSTTNLLMT